MKATIFAMIAFSAAAIVLSGCSGDNRVTGLGNSDTPEIDKNLVETTTPAVTENNAARIALNSFNQEIKRIGFEATVKKSDVEGGCLYLETGKTERYTPYFEESTPGLRVGQQLYVSGYVDENMSSYCMIGPVFHVEKYTLLWRNDYGSEVGAEAKSADAASASTATAGTAAADGGSHDAASDDAASRDDLTALTGYYFTNDEGCEYITDGKDITAELQFNWVKAPLIPNGTLISVRGEYSLLTWSPCLLAQLFYVEEFEALDSNHYVAEDGRAGN